MKTKRVILNTAIGLLLIAVYFLVAQAGLLLQAEVGGITPLWPSVGLGIAVLWLGGVRWWPVILIGEILVAWRLGQPWTQGVTGGVAELAECFLALYLIRRGGIRTLFRTVDETVYFCLVVCLVPPVVGASLGTFGLWLHGLVGSGTWQVAWFTWWLGDAMAILIVTPLIVVWSRWPFRRTKQVLEWGAIVLLLAGSGSILVYATGPHGDYFLFILMPFMAWAAVRYRAAGATSVAVVLTILVLSMASAGTGLLEGSVRVGFIGAAAYMGYLLAAGFAEQLVLSRQLRYQARHDPGTGLYNRAAFNARLAALVETKSGRGHALIALKLDHFQLVTDTCGHEAGERLLSRLGGKLFGILPEKTPLYRLGEDAFGVLLPDTAMGRARKTASELRRAVLDFEFAVDDYSFGPGVSIGVTTFDEQEAPAAIVSRGDIACFKAGQDGGNSICAYLGGDLDMRRHHSELEWITAFHDSLRKGEFRLYGQRILPLHPREGDGAVVEVLLRLRHGLAKSVPSDTFMPIVERYGLAPRLDRWVIDQCFAFLAAHPHGPDRLSINVSARTVDRPSFPEWVEALVRDYDVQPGRILFEVTEHIAIYDMGRAVSTMKRLSAQGFRFALDDFGSGVASFGYLEKLPVHAVKIDGQFIRDLPVNPASGIVVESLQKLARYRGIECVAEWVESRRCLEAVEALGVDYVQGHYLHRPQPLAELGTAHPPAASA